MLEGLLAADTGHHGQWIPCGPGHLAGFVSYRAKDIDTVLGPIRLERAYCHCRQCRAGVVPRDAELGVTGTSLSGGMSSMIATAGAAVPMGHAAGPIRGLAGISLGTKRVERAAEAAGAAAVLKADTAAVLAGRVVPLPPPGPAPEILYIAVDGTGVPMTLAETEGRAGKGPDGRARTHEAKPGSLFTPTGLDEQGRPVRDPDSTSHLATLEPVEKVLGPRRRRSKAPQLWAHPSTRLPRPTEPNGF